MPWSSGIRESDYCRFQREGYNFLKLCNEHFKTSTKVRR